MKKRRIYERVAEALLGAIDGAELGWRYGNVVALRPADASDTATATDEQAPSLVGGKGAQAPAREESNKTEATTRENLNEEYSAFLKRARAER
jgi:hypothetical protein